MAKSSRTFLLSACTVLMLVSGSSEAATTKLVQENARPTQEVFMHRLAQSCNGLSSEVISNHDNTPFLRTHQASAEEETLVEMDFSGFKDGSETELGTHVTEAYLTEGNPYIDPSLVGGQEGWWGIGVYSAGGACALAHPNYGGAISTPMMNLYGNLHISCRVKVREGNKGSVILFFTLASADIWYPSNPLLENGMYYIVFKPEDIEKGWMDVSADIPCTYTGDDAYIQFNSVCYSQTGIIIDDIKVTRDLNFVSKPTAVRFGDFSANGFSASWNPGAENKSYLVNLIEEITLASDEVEFSENFEDPESCDSWTDQGAVRVTAGGADGSAALKITGDAAIELPVNYGAFNNLSLWIATDGIDKDSEAELLIHVLKDGIWGKLGSIVLKNADAEGGIINLAESVKGFAGEYTGVRFYCNDFAEGENAYIDNIEWSTLGAYERNDIMKGKECNDNSIAISDLNMDNSFYFQVAGINGELISPYTSLTPVRGVAAPAMLQATDINPEAMSYTANWEKEPKADSYLITNYTVRLLKEEEECEVFYDSFENAKANEDGNIQHIDGSSFDGIADHNGWHASVPYMSDGKIGGAVIYSPEIPLHNNDGEFTLRFTAYAFGNGNIVVQSGYETQTARITAEYDPMTGTYSEGIAEVEMTFRNGSQHSYLAFYTLEEMPIMIANVSVSQSAKDGDMFFEPISTVTADAGKTSMVFDNLPACESNIYAYHIRAVREYSDGYKVASDTKDNIIVEMKNANARSALADGTRILNHGDNIEVILTEPADITVYDATGATIRHLKGNAGSNVITGIGNGVFIVKADEATAKTVL